MYYCILLIEKLTWHLFYVTKLRSCAVLGGLSGVLVPLLSGTVATRVSLEINGSSGRPVAVPETRLHAGAKEASVLKQGMMMTRLQTFGVSAMLRLGQVKRYTPENRRCPGHGVKEQNYIGVISSSAASPPVSMTYPR